MTVRDGELPSRSADGLAALDVFYDEFNDVHFYVEDAEQENLYELLLKEAFPGLTITRIFPLGGKEAVIQHARLNPVGSMGPYGAHIVDKDFDDLLGTIVPFPHLFYLDRYCIENYLIQSDAVVEIVVESNPRKKRTNIEGELDLQSTTARMLDELRPLFALFYCVQRFQLGLENCGTKPERFCVDATRWRICETALNGYRDEVVAAAARAGIAPPLLDPLLDGRIAHVTTADSQCLVSGKFIGAMLHHYVKSKFSLGTMTLDSFIYRLAKNGDRSALKPVTTRIAAAALYARPNVATKLQAQL
jgi:hypothetical protein